MSNAPALVPQQNNSLVVKFAERFGVEHGKLLSTLKATAFKVSGGKEVSNEQMMALLIVADQYKLNPFTKEIFAFEDKHKGIVPVVSVDGWSRIINEHPQYDGVEFAYSDKLTTMPGGKSCPEWCEASIFRKDRSRAITLREYLDEVYVGPRGNPPVNGPWQTHTKRFLRHKTFIQCARIAFGFAGIYDEDEAHRIIEGESVRVQQHQHVPRTDPSNVRQLASQLAARTPAADDVIDVEADKAEGGQPVGSKTLRAAIFMADTLEDLAPLESQVGELPDGDDRNEVNELFLSRHVALSGVK